MNTDTTTVTVQARKRKRGLWKRVVLIALALVLLLIGAGFAYEAIASEAGKRDYPMPGKLVDAGGYKLHLNQQGKGSITIVLEAGSGETSLSWKDIPEQLAPYAKVVSYDRAGYAWSEKADTERTGANIVRELHTALHKEGLRGPYLFVGHSLGGTYSRLFAQTYRDEVAGLVLVDARPENDEKDAAPITAREKFTKKPPAAELTLLKQSGVLRLFQNSLLEGLVPKEERSRFLNIVATPGYFEAAENEGKLVYTSEDAIRGQNLGNLPVRVIARGLPQDYAAFGFSKEGGEKLEEIWQNGQRNMLGISSKSKLIVAEKSGHMVMEDQPELVTKVILDLLQDLTTPR